MLSPGVKTRSPSSRGLRTGEEWWPCWDLCSSARCREVVSSVVGPRCCAGFDVCSGTVFFCKEAPCRLVAGVFASVVTGPWGRGKMGKRKDVVVVVELLSSAACVLVYLWEACMGGDGVLAVLCWLSTAVRG